MTTIPNNLQELRKQKNLRQQDVANILGLVSNDRISHWEKGSAVPSLENLCGLCALYEVSLEDLYPEYLEGIRVVVEKRKKEFKVLNVF